MKSVERSERRRGARPRDVRRPGRDPTRSRDELPRRFRTARDTIRAKLEPFAASELAH
jgi:hypothetical protein